MKAATTQPVSRSSVSPDTKIAEAQLKVSKLRNALAALEGTSGVEVDAIKKALKKAEADAQQKPMTEQIAECKGFIERAEKRLQKLEVERLSEVAMLEEGRARLVRLEAQAAASVPLPPAANLDLEAEVSRLREELAAARGGMGPSGENQPQKKRLREEYVPCTLEEAALWIRSRQFRDGGSHFEGQRTRRVEVGAGDCGGCSPVAPMDPTAFFCGEHGQLRAQIGAASDADWCIRVVHHQCGFRGCRVGEASNPGPVLTRRQARRLEDHRVSTQIDVSSEDEPLVRPMEGRNVVARRESSEATVVACGGEDGEPMAT